MHSEMGSQTDTDPAAVARATIHARQDLVLALSWQQSQHEQLVMISRGVWLIALLLLVMLLQIGRVTP